MSIEEASRTLANWRGTTDATISTLLARVDSAEQRIADLETGTPTVPPPTVTLDDQRQTLLDTLDNLPAGPWEPPATLGEQLVNLPTARAPGYSPDPVEASDTWFELDDPDGFHVIDLRNGGWFDRCVFEARSSRHALVMVNGTQSVDFKDCVFIGGSDHLVLGDTTGHFGPEVSMVGCHSIVHTDTPLTGNLDLDPHMDAIQAMAGTVVASGCTFRTELPNSTAPDSTKPYDGYAPGQVIWASANQGPTSVDLQGCLIYGRNGGHMIGGRPHRTGEPHATLAMYDCAVIPEGQYEILHDTARPVVTGWANNKVLHLDGTTSPLDPWKNH